ncbi:MAG: transcription elongation factor Spt6 [Amphiamblys sp. WSBS2006]|nr:MAG: transcription elongation factor Spt6 [Amphiamblys sp. WSBS2006]
MSAGYETFPKRLLSTACQSKSPSNFQPVCQTPQLFIPAAPRNMGSNEDRDALEQEDRELIEENKLQEELEKARRTEPKTKKINDIFEEKQEADANDETDEYETAPQYGDLFAEIFGDGTEYQETFEETDEAQEELERKQERRLPEYPIDIEDAGKWIHSRLGEAADLVSVFNAVSLMKEDVLEVPFIEQHRKEHVPGLSLQTLWDIYDLCEKYTTLVERREKLAKKENIDCGEIESETELYDAIAHHSQKRVSWGGSITPEQLYENICQKSRLHAPSCPDQPPGKASAAAKSIAAYPPIRKLARRYLAPTARLRITETDTGRVFEKQLDETGGLEYLSLQNDRKRTQKIFLDEAPLTGLLSAFYTGDPSPTIKEAVGVLAGLVEKELHRTRMETASKIVATQTMNRLAEKISDPPHVFRKPEKRIAVLTLDEKGPYCVVMDSLGNVARKYRTEGTAQSMLEGDVAPHRPEFVAVSGRSPQIVDLLAAARRVFGAAVEAEYVDDSVARIVAGREEGPEHTEAYAQSVGRYLLNPLHETAKCGSDILRLQIHPRQAEISPDLLRKYTGRAFINAVNAAGLDPNRAVLPGGASSCLQYVCGLGPSSASHLEKSLRKEQLLSRKELGGRLGTHAALQAAGTLVLDTETVRDPEKKGAVHILDTLRIHPEDYPLVEEIAQRTVQTNTAVLCCVSEMLQAQKEKLAVFPFEEFADEIEQRNGQKKRATLQKIKTVLLPPAVPPSCRHRLGPEELFNMVSPIPLERLRAGELVNATVAAVLQTRIICSLAENITAVVPCHLTDVPPGTPLSAVFSKGGALRGVPIHVDVEAFTVTLSTRQQDTRLKTAPSRPPASRTCHHPLFKNISRVHAEALLETRQPGECIIRPSSLPDQLAITLKIADGLCWHIPVAEFERPTEYALGKHFYVQKRRCSSVDELARHAALLYQKIAGVKESRKYTQPDTAIPERQLCETKLRRLKSSADHIPYLLTLSAEHPGRILLAVLTKRCFFEYIHPAVDGYLFRGRLFATVQELTNWFKRNTV